jgi:hypothetical protein
MLKVNEQTVPYQEGVRLKDLVDTYKPGADLFIVNGFPASPDTVPADGDICCLIRRGETPTAKEIKSLLAARHTPGVHEIVQKARVGIMGLGGLGTVVAGAMARIGVGKLTLADFDRGGTQQSEPAALLHFPDRRKEDRGIKKKSATDESVYHDQNRGRFTDRGINPSVF